MGPREENSKNLVLKTSPDTAGAVRESFASERVKKTVKTRDDPEYSSSPSQNRERIETMEEMWEKETEQETVAEEILKEVERGKRRRRLSEV